MARQKLTDSMRNAVLVFWSQVLRLPLGASDYVPELALLHSLLGHLPGSAALPPVQKWDRQHKFLQRKGAHTDLVTVKNGTMAKLVKNGQVNMCQT